MIRRPPRSSPLSLHDALPISQASVLNLYDTRADEILALFRQWTPSAPPKTDRQSELVDLIESIPPSRSIRSEEHTSELQSHLNLVCRLLLEKKKKKIQNQRLQ